MLVLHFKVWTTLKFIFLSSSWNDSEELSCSHQEVCKKTSNKTEFCNLFTKHKIQRCDDLKKTCSLFTCLSFDPNDMLTLNKIWQCQRFHSSTTMFASKYRGRRGRIRNQAREWRKVDFNFDKPAQCLSKTLVIETKWVLWVVPDPPQHIVNLACERRFSRLIVRTNTTLLEY